MSVENSIWMHFIFEGLCPKIARWNLRTKWLAFVGRAMACWRDLTPRIDSLSVLASISRDALENRGIINRKVDLRTIVERFPVQNVVVFAAKLSERSKGAQVKHPLNPEDHSKTRLKNAAINFETKECLKWPSRACSVTSRVWWWLADDAYEWAKLRTINE